MHRLSPWFSLTIAFAAAVGASCGSGGGANFGGGISGSGIVVGTITGFGSIFVNDIEFETTSATIRLEGQEGSEADLRLGMVVTVRGEIAAGAMTGVADSVDFEDVLEGPVDSVDVAAGLIVVFSQLVVTDQATVFDDTSLATLMPGDVVEVSGFVDATGNIRATRVELEEDGEEFELKGTITDIDLPNETFMIGGLTVDYSSAEIEGAPPGGLAIGLVVEVKASSPPVADVLVADKVEVEDEDLGGDEGDELEIEGFITDVVSPDEFIVNGSQLVRVTAGTEFEEGTAQDIAVNVRVEVEGLLDSGDVLVAEKVAFKD